MAICTKCGTIMHDDDMLTHECDLSEIPKKGEKFKFNGTKSGGGLNGL